MKMGKCSAGGHGNTLHESREILCMKMGKCSLRGHGMGKCSARGHGNILHESKEILRRSSVEKH
jgi:hypothetical protein